MQSNVRRFENEAAMLRGWGAVLFRVTRHSVESHDSHASEQEQRSLTVDHFIHNEVMDGGTFAAATVMKLLRRENECGGLP